MFKIIGQKCGGLLDIARSTKELSFLSYTRVKMRGLMEASFRKRWRFFAGGKKFK